MQTVADRAWHAAHAPIVGADAVERFLDEYYDEESFRSRVDDATTILDVAESGGDVVGFVAAIPADEDGVFDLGQIYVAPDRWGEGVGGRLLARAEQAVGRRGGERIELGVVAENERAVAFYESAGYRRTGEFYDDRLDARGYEYAKQVG